MARDPILQNRKTALAILFAAALVAVLYTLRTQSRANTGSVTEPDLFAAVTRWNRGTTLRPVCGNRRIEAGEQCEPYIRACPAGQACTNCQCTGAMVGTQATATCGDGRVEGNERCDPPGSSCTHLIPNPGDRTFTCSASCACEAVPYSCTGQHHPACNSPGDSCIVSDQGRMLYGTCDDRCVCTNLGGPPPASSRASSSPPPPPPSSSSPPPPSSSSPPPPSSSPGGSGSGGPPTSCRLDGFWQVQLGEECDGMQGMCNWVIQRCDNECRCVMRDPVCGDGLRTGDEECDRMIPSAQCGSGSERVCNDQCRCAMPVCGNNVKEGAEQCDGFDIFSCRPTGYICTPNCLCAAPPPVCGNGNVETGEQCEDGNTATNDACVNCQNARCGDGSVRAGVEQCDGANDSICRNQGYACSTDCRCTPPICGNGTREGFEQCDGSNAPCPGGRVCASCSCIQPPVCGNNVREGPEQCDGTAVQCPSGTVCNAQCQCQQSTGTLVCGNGVKEGAERCDSINLVGRDANGQVVRYNRDCLVGQECSQCQCVASNGTTCGNGSREVNEQCDAPTPCPSGQTCTDQCQCLVPASVSSAPISSQMSSASSVQTALCGNNRMETGETCDDGNPATNDACVNCQNARCGDGFVRTGVEQCDDRNQAAADGCGPTCQYEFCGDGVVQSSKEQCDDGNTRAGDSCNPWCRGSSTPPPSSSPIPSSAPFSDPPPSSVSSSTPLPSSQPSPVSFRCNNLPATIYVNASNVIAGGPQNGQTYAGTLRGTAGDDVMVGAFGNDTINGEGGNDMICGAPGDDMISAGDGADGVLGGAGNDFISGGPGNDSLYGEDGNDDMNGDDGNDLMHGQGGDDSLKGNRGTDSLFGDAGSDMLQGEDDGDLLCGGTEGDVLFGGWGDDTIDGQAGGDTVSGGVGADICAGESVQQCESIQATVPGC